MILHAGTFCLDVAHIHQQRGDLNLSFFGLFSFVSSGAGLFGLVHAAAV